MTSLAWLIPCALLLGAFGLAAFLWALSSGQFEDLEGAAWRILDDIESDDDDGGKIDSNQASAGLGRPIAEHANRSEASAGRL